MMKNWDNDMSLMQTDKVCLNSYARPIKSVGFSIVKLVVMFIVLTTLVTYIQTGEIGIHLNTIGDYFRPGQPLFAVFVGSLPILAVSAAALYYGEGSKERLGLSLVKVGLSLLWLYFIGRSMSNLDLLEMSGIDTSKIMNGLQSFVINASPLFTMVMILTSLTVIIPVAEYFGARKKRAEVLEFLALREEYKRAQAQNAEGKTEEKAEVDQVVEEPPAPVQADVKSEWSGTPTLNPVSAAPVRNEDVQDDGTASATDTVSKEMQDTPNPANRTFSGEESQDTETKG